MRTIDVLVVDFREIAPAVDVDFPSRAFEKGNRRVLQASLGHAQFQSLIHFL